MTKFGEINPLTGEVKYIGEVQQSDMRMCPHFLMVFEHYRPDGTCRCDDPDHSEMIAWGYAWDVATERWVAPLEEDDE